MANRFLNNIKINDSYTLPAADGTADQVITTNGSGQLSFVDQSAITAGTTEKVVIYAKNTHTTSIVKGTPVYITGTVGATDTVTIAPADASNSAKMPAVGILDATLAVNDFGYVITGGFMDNITTSPIDGTTPSSNDTVYVKAGGGLTMTKPTGSSNLIQNIAKVGKVSGGNAGSLIVSSILRTNDVPNLSTGKIWVGDGNTIESTVVHLDETNGRMGIGTTSPSASLSIDKTNVYQHRALDLENDSITYSMYIDQDNVGTDSWSLFDTTNSQTALKYLPSASGYWQFYTNNAARLRIDSSGRVGISTTSPSEKLDVNGSIKSGNIKIEPANGGRIGLNRNTATGAIYNNSYGAFQIQNNGGGFFEIQSYNNSGTSTGVLSMLESNGNVGIGTTSPVDKLQIDAPHSQLRLRDTDDGTFTQFSSSGDKLAIRQNSTSANHIWLTSSGNVGIGTASPQQKLHVDGGTYLDGKVGIGITPTTTWDVIIKGQYPLQLTDSSSSAKFEFYGDLGENRYLNGAKIVGYGQDLFIDTSSSGYDIILGPSGGNVGIGTTSPDTILEVVDENPILTVRDTSTGLSSANAALRLAESGSGDTLDNYWDLKMKPEPVGGTTNFAIANNSLGEVLNINYQGNVGIGVTPEAWAVFNPVLRIGAGGSLAGTGVSNFRMFANTYYDGSYKRIGSGFATQYEQDGYHAWYTAASGAANSAISWSERMRIDSNGAVGVGLTNPYSYGFNGVGLAVKNSSGYGIVTIASDTDKTGYLAFADGTSGDERYRGTVEYTHSIDTMYFRTSGSARMTIDSSGNVGIGGTPTHKLYVRNDVAATSDLDPTAIKLYNNSDGGSAIEFSNGVAGNSKLSFGVEGTGGFTDETYIGFSTSVNGATATERMRIDSSGNVGIGTTSPDNKLHVDGNGNSIYAIFSRADTKWMYLHSGSVDPAIGWDTAGDLRFGTSTSNVGGGFSEKMRIDSSGNVGIGTASPINGGGNAKWVTIDGVSGSSYSGGIVYSIGGSAKGYHYVGNNNIIHQAQTGLGHRFLANAGDAMTITSGRNVGIGTTSPSNILHIQSSSATGALLNLETTHSGGIPIYNMKGAHSAQLRYQDENGNNQSRIDFNDGGDFNFVKATDSTSHLKITSSGNVGIGTTSPTRTFHSKGGSGVSTIGKFEAGTANAYIQISSTGQSDADSGYIGYDSSRVMTFWTANTERMRINSSGNVGIGTTSPSSAVGFDAKLQLESANPMLVYKETDQSTKWEVGAWGGNYVVYNGANERMRINSAGNVGIGTTSPAAKLQIQGLASTTDSDHLILKATNSLPTTVGRMIDFTRSNGSVRGYVTMNQYGVQYNTSSDYRIKRNIVKIQDGIQRIKQLKPSRFNWSDGPDSLIVDGFIAHEAQKVVPEAVTGEKDDLLPNGEPNYQGIDQAKLVPLLTAALQEAITKIENLESRIQTLENQ